MINVKKSLNSMFIAAVLLLTNGLVNFSIIEVVKAATGWTMPKWLAVVLAGVGVATSVVAILASFGVTIPASVAKIVACCTGTAA